MISSQNIVRVCDPETSRCLIRIKKTPRFLCQYSQIMFQIVLGLSCIFNEECMSFYIIGYIIYQSEIVNTVNSASTIIRLMNRISLDIGVMNSSDQVEVNWITTELKFLSTIKEFNVFNSRYQILLPV